MSKYTRNPFVFCGTTEHNGEIMRSYIYKNLSIIVSHTNFSYELNAELPAEKTCLHISFSRRNGNAMRQQDIEFCLNHFGMKQDLPVFTFDKPTSFTPHYMIRHFEQIQCRKVGA